jgi:hypothetical protein
MKSLVTRFAAGVVSAFVSVSASAGSSASASFQTAPQLLVAGSGPVSATFLGSSAPFAQMFFSWDSTAVGFFFGPSTAVGATFQESPQQTPLNPFGPGTEVTFAALFGTPGTTSAALSATAATSSVRSVLTTPSMGEPAPGIAFNAGVIETRDGVLIGFNSPGAGMPSDFAGFAVRIAASNVCVK